MSFVARRRPILLRNAVHWAACLLALLFIVPALPLEASPISTGADPETGLKFWQWLDEGVQLRLTQRLPDQTRAFFLARGFSASDANKIALACVFQSMLKNTTQGSADIEFDIRNWRVISEQGISRPLTREDWSAEWEKRQVSKPAQIAFEWSLLPTRQTYSVGDYNWGMSSYGLPPGSRFSLEFSWQRGSKIGTGRIDGIECPADIHPEPQQ